jgi:diguanylate cyclase (GGDEF)-like protein
LTGLLSRRSFDPTIATALDAYTEGRGIVALILADLDGFKRINDRFGHWAGDQVLKRVAAVLQAVTGDEGVVCRYGGDEFVVLSTATTVSRARQLAIRLKAAIGFLVVTWQGQSIAPLSIRTGLAYCPRDGICAAELIHAADVAMVRGDDDPPPSPTGATIRGPKPLPTDARANSQDDGC